jgi:flagellar biosynthesis protein FliQ
MTLSDFFEAQHYRGAESMFNDFAKSVIIGAVATALASALGSLGLSVFWAVTASQPSMGWILIALFAVVLPSIIFGGFVGGVIFALVNVLANSIRIEASPVSYAGIALLLSAVLAFAFAVKMGGEGVNILPILFPVPVLAAGLYVGWIVARSRAEAQSAP